MFFKLLFLESCVMFEGLWGTLSPLLGCCMMFIFFLLPAWATCGGVTIIESYSCTRQGDPLGGPLFILAHYRVFLQTIARPLIAFFHP
jgi:hypothetical protein